MSDLDADLYGDLYGNDEADFNEQVLEEDKKDVLAYEQQSTSPVTTMSASTTVITDPRLASRADIKPVQAAVTTPASANAAATIGSSSQSYSSPNQPGTSGSTTPPSSTSPLMPLTQKIPTYEQPQSGYRDSARLSSERTVRPSEMKDEGDMASFSTLWATVFTKKLHGQLARLMG
ncbi:hypothetical protein APHAL10511_000677 [Amanita phalloides]|nr:hypothetical protein APHAL10511_000677 [Amanita phalloides]